MTDTPRSPKKQQFNVYLTPELIRRAKYRALDDQVSLSDLVERALITFLESGDPHD
jgi:predicted HicB family RNase H-like nuclease